MKIRYSGQHTAVDLMLPGGAVHVEKNGRVDVPDEIGEMLISGPHWRRSGGRSRQEAESEDEQEAVTEAAAEPDSVEIEQES